MVVYVSQKYAKSWFIQNIPKTTLLQHGDKYSNLPGFMGNKNEISVQTIEDFIHLIFLNTIKHCYLSRYRHHWL